MIQQHFTVLTLLAIFKTNKYQILVLVHSQSEGNVRPPWGFLTIVYKYITQQYFTVTAPNTVFSQYLKQIKYQMLVLVHLRDEGNIRPRWGFLSIFYKYIIQQYFAVTTLNTVFSQYSKQIKYQMLAVACTLTC